MKNCSRTLRVLLLVGMLCVLLPTECPAPLVWRKGEGWSYERYGMPVAKTPREQLELARNFHANKQYGEAIAAYRRLIRRWPTAFAVEEARLGLAECLSALDYHYKAFLEYQNLIAKHT
ncbi:MAG: outer membrane protein assembly factor BamD, partial [Verrucomicrobiae bacterium]|nr:outer membrane protein assembly factor BamD [Verrucomicrobiae bacterium]